MKPCLTIMIIFLLLAQEARSQSSIQFTKGLSWAQIREKAKKENKYIFLDVYTTWCGPCRMMDKQVFTQDSVAGFFNAGFINVKVQCDKTKNDTEEIKKWYADAKEIQDTYKISLYPTYLFFNPDGELVHTLLGAEPDGKAFIAKAKMALDPATQYLKLKASYEAGERDPAFLLKLTNAARRTRDAAFFPVVGNTYLATQTNLLSDEHLKLIVDCTRKSADPGFKVLLHNADKADSVAGKPVSRELLRTIIFDEVALPYLRIGGEKKDYGGGMVIYTGDMNKNVDWNVLKARLDSLYPQQAREVMVYSKPTYYEWSEDWKAFAQVVSEYASQQPAPVAQKQINQWARTIFVLCEDQDCLNAATKWSEKTLAGADENNPEFLYTYGNLLYKTGKKEPAIEVINRMAKISGDNGGQLKELVDKMQKGEPTW